MTGPGWRRGQMAPWWVLAMVAVFAAALAVFSFESGHGRAVFRGYASVALAVFALVLAVYQYRRSRSKDGR